MWLGVYIAKTPHYIFIHIPYVAAAVFAVSVSLSVLNIFLSLAASVFSVFLVAKRMNVLLSTTAIKDLDLEQMAIVDLKSTDRTASFA